MERDAELQGLLDKQAIRETLLRYCRGVDRCDPDLIASAFHPDAFDDHGSFKADAAGFVDWLMPLLRDNHTSTTHFIGNQLIDLDGDTAWSEAYLVAFHRIERDGERLDWIFGGRYADRFERRDGEWKIAHRRLIQDWSRVDPVGDRTWARPDDFVAGLRSRDDVTYERTNPNGS